jgi:hypothetical protein
MKGNLYIFFFVDFYHGTRLTKSHMFYRLVVKCIQCNHVTVFLIPFNNACIFIMSSCNIDIKGAYSPRFLCRPTAFMDLLSHGYSKSVKAVRWQRNLGLRCIYIHANPRETKSGRGSRVCHAPPAPRKLFFRRMQNGAFCCILDIKSVQSNL